MNYLVDTNIFLEILLNQAGRKKCEAFLRGEKGASWISDFTLHSIGVLLFRQKRPELFDRFAADALPQFTSLSLSDAGYSQLAKVNIRHGLDFDDAY
jgi:predicted nucleic acid-binding protein